MYYKHCLSAVTRMKREFIYFNSKSPIKGRTNQKSVVNKRVCGTFVILRKY